MTRKSIIILIVSIVTVCVLFLVDLWVGSVSLSAGEVWRGLWGEAESGATGYIVRGFRLPKAIVATLAGAALGASGLQMQTLFRNPLAGPYVLGISSGASLGVALFMLGAPLLGLSEGLNLFQNIGIVGAAWIGAGLIFLLIVAVSHRIKDIMVILILGMMLGSVAGAVVEIFQYFSSEGAVKSYVVWTMGSLGAVTLSDLWVLVPVILVGLGLSIVVIKPLNAMMLGEQYARTMGVNVAATRALIFASTTLLAGTVTAFCGPIGFVGLAVPHIARIVFGEADHRTLMPATMVIGAAVVLGCDIVSGLPGRTPLPINTVTALVGIPIIIMVVVRRRKFF
jgi:iron complex transport system permease protein